jgi:Domain of unknown function (DUF6468)
MIELAANLLVAFLLVLTTSWCVLLYRRLDRLRVERSDVESFLAAVDGAVRRAEQAVAGIRDGAGEAQRLLAAEQGQAQQRAAELARLVDSAGRMARRVETAIHQGARAMAEDSLERDRGGQRSVRDDGARPAGASDGREVRERPARPRIDAELLKALESLR